MFFCPSNNKCSKNEQIQFFLDFHFFEPTVITDVITTGGAEDRFVK
jgi:hypothetical protein